MFSTLLYFLVALGVLVFVHELGHFLVAKSAGIRVERFSLGYPPKAIGFRLGETEYCISWIPFGGYVKVAGMADVGTEAVTGAPWEFPSKPIWIRMAVIAAGPMMNFLFALVALVFLFRAYGIDTFDSTRIEPQAASLAAASGLQRGDRILRVGTRPVDDAYSLSQALRHAAASGAELLVQRGPDTLSLRLPPAGRAKDYGVNILRPTTVGRVVPDMPAAALGLRKGDRIIAVAGHAVSSWTEMSRTIRQFPAQQIEISWMRDGQRIDGVVTPAAITGSDGTIGQIGIGPQVFRHRVDLWESWTLGLKGVYYSSRVILDFLGELSRGQRSAKELGGPLRIAQLAGESAHQGLDPFISFLAMLSVNLAILNLLPIPVLDGGQLLFLALEAIRRRPLSVRQREIVQQIGLAIMLFIMVLVTFNDLNQMVFHRISELFR